MKILSYSERGAINSLFYEIGFKKPVLFKEFLDLIYFPFNVNGDYTKICFHPIIDENGPIILIEQSFSDFGDADIVFLFDDEKLGKTIIFVEAKVSAEHKKWSLLNQYEKGFIDVINGVKNNDGFSSNIFTQLYHKWGLIQFIKNYHPLENYYPSIKDPSIKIPSIKLELSPKGNTAGERKLGNNTTVIKAAKLIEKYINEDNIYYVGLIPDNRKNLNKTFSISSLDSRYPKPKEKFGLVHWEEVYENLIKRNNAVLTNTIGVFSHNQDNKQIY